MTKSPDAAAQDAGASVPEFEPTLAAIVQETDAETDELLGKRREMIESGRDDDAAAEFMAKSLAILEHLAETRRRAVALILATHQRQRSARSQGPCQRIAAVAARLPRATRATRSTRQTVSRRIAAFASAGKAGGSDDSAGDSPPGDGRSLGFPPVAGSWDPTQAVQS